MPIRSDPAIAYLLAIQRELVEVLAKEPNPAERQRLAERIAVAQERLMELVERRFDARKKE